MKFEPVSRRTFLSTSCAALATSNVLAGSKSDRYSGLNSRKYLGPIRRETVIRDEQVFTEGPAGDPRSDAVYFTNVPVSKILKWDPAAKKLTVFRENTNKTNGTLFDSAGNMLNCEGGAGRVTRTDMSTGKVTVLADSYRGFPFAAPNDIALDKHGRIYFTSRPGVEDPAKGNVNAVYRLDVPMAVHGKWGVTQLLAWPDVHMPNGIVISPDNKTLYLIEAHPDADRNRNILAFDLNADGSLSNRRVHINFYPGRSGDGMCIDAEGNLYVAAGLHKRRNTSETLDTRPGVHVISPTGKLIAFGETTRDTVTNCAFGGKDLKTLYVTCGTELVSFRTTIPGKAAYRPSLES